MFEAGNFMIRLKVCRALEVKEDNSLLCLLLWAVGDVAFTGRVESETHSAELMTANVTSLFVLMLKRTIILRKTATTDHSAINDATIHAFFRAFAY